MPRKARAKPKLCGWKFDPVALAALFLSLIAAGAQLWDWWHGPQIRLIPPDRVALYSQVAPDGSVAIRIAANMSYANVAQAQYGDLVLIERAKLKVDQIESWQRWNAFGEIRESAITRTQDAAPQPLPGQSAVTHFTLFTPVPRVCPNGSSACDPMRDYISPEEMMLQVRTADRIEFRFEIDLFNGHTLTTSCYVPLSALVRQKLGNIMRTPLYATCHSPHRHN